MLKINTLPESGGDTMWWNTYDLLEKMSPSMQEYLSTLEAEHSAEFFHGEARRLGIKIRPERERGHPLNKGDHLTAVHPVVRTSEFFFKPLSPGDSLLNLLQTQLPDGALCTLIVVSRNEY